MHRLYFSPSRFMFTLVYSPRSQGCTASALPRTEINCRAECHAWCVQPVPMRDKRTWLRFAPKRPVTFAVATGTTASITAFRLNSIFNLELNRRCYRLGAECSAKFCVVCFLHVYPHSVFFVRLHSHVFSAFTCA